MCSGSKLHQIQTERTMSKMNVQPWYPSVSRYWPSGHCFEPSRRYVYRGYGAK